VADEAKPAAGQDKPDAVEDTAKPAAAADVTPPEGDGAESKPEAAEPAVPVIEVEGELIDEAPAATAVEGAGIDAELRAAQAEAERHLDDMRRLKADFENYRKRTLREQSVMAATAAQALVTKLLPVMDHFELAIAALSVNDAADDEAKQARTGDFDKMRKGVEMVFGELRDVLRGQGLEPIEAEGKPFDPQRHEAVASVADSDAEPGTVVDVVRAGYELHGRVIRPAMVRVAQ
jgi:molecular chaperone GrpE